MDRNKNSAVIEIDLLQLIRALFDKAWLVFMSVVLCAALSFCYATFLVTPTYQASALLFVNNNTINFGGTSLILTGDDLISTYSVILRSRLTLTEVIDEMGLPYDYNTLKSMVSSLSVDETQVFQITVTSSDPKEAEEIANKLADIMPVKITAVMDGCSVRVVDYAVVPNAKTAPNIARYTTIGALIGFLIAAMIVVIRMINDTAIHNEEYLEQHYQIPVLAVIPDLLDTSNSYSYQKKPYQMPSKDTDKTASKDSDAQKREESK